MCGGSVAVEQRNHLRRPATAEARPSSTHHRLDRLAHLLRMVLDLVGGERHPVEAEFVVGRLALMISLEGALVKLATVDFHDQAVVREQEQRAGSPSKRKDKVDAVQDLAARRDNRHLSPWRVAEVSESLKTESFGVALRRRLGAALIEDLVEQPVAGASRSANSQSCALSEAGPKRMFDGELDAVDRTNAVNRRGALEGYLLVAEVAKHQCRVGDLDAVDDR